MAIAPARLRAALRRGLKLRVAVPGAGRLAASARSGRRTVATAPARTVGGPGRVALTLRFSAAARRALARRRRARLTVTLTFTAAGGGDRSTVHATATLR